MKENLFVQSLLGIKKEYVIKNLKLPFVFLILTFDLWPIFAKGWCLCEPITFLIGNVFLKLNCLSKVNTFFYIFILIDLGFVIFRYKIIVKNFSFFKIKYKNLTMPFICIKILSCSKKCLQKKFFSKGWLSSCLRMVQKRRKSESGKR